MAAAGEETAYHVVEIVGDDGGRELEAAAGALHRMVDMRHAWVARWEAARHTAVGAGWKEDGYGVVSAGGGGAAGKLAEYVTDVRRLRETVQSGSCRSATRTRLDILEKKYLMYRTLNQDLEAVEEKDLAAIPIIEPVPATEATCSGAAHAPSSHGLGAQLGRMFAFQPVLYMPVAEYLAAYAASPAADWVPRRVVVVLARPDGGCADLKSFLRRTFLPFWAAGAGALGPLGAHVRGFLFAGRDEGEEMASLDIPEADLAATPLPDVPDALLLYFVWRSVAGLNQLRARHGAPPLTFALRAVHRDHLISGYLLCTGVHGCSLRLSQQYVLLYMFYLMHVSLACSPVEEAARGDIAYPAHPIQRLLAMGVRVALDAGAGWGGFRGELATCMNVFRLSLSDAREVGAVGFGRHGGGIRGLFRAKTHRDEHRVLRSAGERVALGKWVSTPIAKAQARNMQNIEDYIDIGRISINGPRIRQGDSPDRPLTVAAEMLRGLLLKRREYISPPDVPGAEGGGASPLERSPDGTSAAFWKDAFRESGGVFGPSPKSLRDFVADYQALCDAVVDRRVVALSRRRLKMLQYKYDIHSSLRRLDETGVDAVGRDTDLQDNRDFYQAVVVDTHVHMAAGMTARDLLEFIQGKATYQSDDIVQVEGVRRKDGGGAVQKAVTLGDVMSRIGVKPAELTVGNLGVQADATVFERFDNFNSKYSPLGKNDLRNLFLKTRAEQVAGNADVLEGRYFAELIKKTFRRMAKNHYAEYRLSIYGKSHDEWDKLAAWHSTHGMSTDKNQWLIQVPRIYPVLKRSGKVASFADMLDNIFAPLWEASAAPGRHPHIDHFLRYTSGFDSVDSEDGAEAAMAAAMPVPAEWTSDENPPYAYWTYYMWANIAALNAYRRERGQSTFSFRPHCGECGNPRHLAAAFLTADGVSHGIQLRLAPPLQYLYYLAQIPIAVSPLSNNSLFLGLEKSPFPQFFKQGLNVSLSTDDPLFFHQTQEPLIEEYSVASKLWRLSSTDLCEIARNSVRQSGFPHRQKVKWGGACYYLDSSISNVEAKTHVPDLRVAYRFEVYHDEVFYLNRVRTLEGHPPPPPCPRYMRTMAEEDALLEQMGRSRGSELTGKRVRAKL